MRYLTLTITPVETKWGRGFTERLTRQSKTGSWRTTVTITSAKFGPGGTADGDIQSASATQAVLDKYMVDVDFCFIDLSHPGLDLRLNSVIHSDAIKFTQEDKDAIETSADGATTFLALTDTPAAFGTAGQVPAVNTAGDGVEFVDQTGGGGFTLHRGTNQPANSLGSRR